MKKKIIFFGLFIVLAIGTYLFFQKHYLQFELADEVKNAEKDFYPDGYTFFHSDKELQDYFNISKETREYRAAPKDIKFDFSKYSYVVVYGRKVKSMHYSYKESELDDISPEYAQPSSHTVVFIEYENAAARRELFLQCSEGRAA